MKVRDLIKDLSGFNPDTEVHIHVPYKHGEYDFRDVFCQDLKIVKVNEERPEDQSCRIYSNEQMSGIENRGRFYRC